MQWFSQAPANIALIKYMGKQDETLNIPANASLSYTLNQLQSQVQLETHALQEDRWEPLNIPGAPIFTLSPEAQTRFLKHLNQIKAYFDYQGGFIVRSSNNFPHSSGLASSASSFAALTKCAVQAIAELTQKPIPSIEEQALLSRRGSGSSCRSFFPTWALWDQDSVKAIDLPYTNLIHQVIIISHAEKKISSGKAHQLIKTSPMYPGRNERANTHLKQLLDALQMQAWEDAFNITWREFHDMHNLFHTSTPAFAYITPTSEKILKLLQESWHHDGDGPLVTMDAGPNIHLLYRQDQHELAQRFKHNHLIGNFDVL